MSHWYRAALASALVAGIGLLGGGQLAAARGARVYGNVDGARIAAADSEPGNWLAHGRTYGEQRYSPLAQVNSGNVGSCWC